MKVMFSEDNYEFKTLSTIFKEVCSRILTKEDADYIRDNIYEFMPYYKESIGFLFTSSLLLILKKDSLIQLININYPIGINFSFRQDSYKILKCSYLDADERVIVRKIFEKFFGSIEIDEIDEQSPTPKQIKNNQTIYDEHNFQIWNEIVELLEPRFGSPSSLDPHAIYDKIRFLAGHRTYQQISQGEK